MISKKTIKVKQGFLYILKNNILGGYKIGITTAPTSRFKQLKVGSKSSLIAYFQLLEYRELEKYLHKMLDEHRVPQSEWFDLTQQQLIDLLEDIFSVAELEFVDYNYAPLVDFGKPAFEFETEAPHMPPRFTSINYFILTAILTTIGFLIGSIS